MTLTDEVLRDLSAREQIRDKIYRYCRGADRIDMAEMASAFWDDGVYVGGPFPEGKPVSELADLGLPEFIRSKWAISKHSISNIIIDVRGEQAFVESYAIANHVSHPTRESRCALIGEENEKQAAYADDQAIEFTLSLRYLDLFECRSDVWRISERRLVLDWSRVLPYAGIASGGLYDLMSLRSSRDLTDPLYTTSS